MTMMKFGGSWRYANCLIRGACVPWEPLALPLACEAQLDLTGEPGACIYNSFSIPPARLTGVLSQIPPNTAECNKVPAVFRPGYWVVTWNDTLLACPQIFLTATGCLSASVGAGKSSSSTFCQIFPG